MFIVILTISGTKESAAPWMSEHKAWLQQGFDDGVFLAAGNLTDVPGGGILAHGLSDAALRMRVEQDPFVRHGIVTVQVVEITPSIVDPRVSFLLDRSA